MADEKKPTYKLSDALNGKFTLKGKHVGKYHYKGKTIDFESCTLAEAEAMSDLGFHGLEKVAKTEAAVDTKKDEKK